MLFHTTACIHENCLRDQLLHLVCYPFFYISWAKSSRDSIEQSCRPQNIKDFYAKAEQLQRKIFGRKAAPTPEEVEVQSADITEKPICFPAFKEEDVSASTWIDHFYHIDFAVSFKDTDPCEAFSAPLFRCIILPDCYFPQFIFLLVFAALQSQIIISCLSCCERDWSDAKHQAAICLLEGHNLQC